MNSFNHLLNWTLKAGSHQFPGPDGGTCINEAALVAAGFAYKPIQYVWQMPECFSRPICEYAMWLNDCANNDDRQRLLPYVTRLACADTPDIEEERANYIHRRTHNCWNAPLMDTGLQVLEGALAIGRRADPFPADEAKARMEAVRTKATAPTSVPGPPFFAKIRSWLTAKEIV